MSGLNNSYVLFTQILHQFQKPGFFVISQRDIHAFRTRNRVYLGGIENGARCAFYLIRYCSKIITFVS